MVNNYLYFYDFVFQHVLEGYIECYGMNLVNTENSINEISKNIVSCCLKSLSKETKDYFSRNFSEYKKFYQDLVKMINNNTKDHFSDILQNNISAPQL